MKIHHFVFICICFFAQQGWGQSNPPNPRAQHNIVVFTKVYGYVRHFSPALAVDTFYGWEDLLLEYLPKVEAAKSDKELGEIIQQCLSPLEPGLIVQPDNKKRKSSKPTHQSCEGFYVRRYNQGWGNRNENATRNQFLYTSNIEKNSLDKHWFETTYEGLRFSMPLTTRVSDSSFKLYNQPREFDPKSKRGKYSSANKYVRMGIVMEVWNVQEYFYPYLKELKLNHDSILKQYLNLVSKDMNEQAFFETLEYFGAAYQDGHAGFMPFVPSSEWCDFVPPIKIQFIEQKMIVTYVADTLKNTIHVGDEVVRIDTIPAVDYFKRKQQKISSATQTWNRYTSESELLLGYKNTSVKLDLIQNGNPETLMLNRTVGSRANDAAANIRPDMYEIREGYFYVNLFNQKDSALKYMAENILPKAKGIVFDCRGYPKGDVVGIILSHLTNDTLYPTQWSIPVQRFPGELTPIYVGTDNSHWIRAPLLPKYTNNIVFIVNGKNISGAESILSIVEHYRLGKLVGEQTAGTNGNINSFIVFGLYQFWHTEMYIPRYDGTSFHGVGIKPDKTVKPTTVQDLLERKDNFILEAIELLK